MHHADNTANIQLTEKENDWPQASCFAHTLQLCIEDGLKIDLVSRSLAHLKGWLHTSAIQCCNRCPLGQPICMCGCAPETDSDNSRKMK